MAGESRVAVFAALVGNLTIAILKLATGLVANSSAMLAEAAHSFSDTGNQVLLIVGLRRAKHPPSKEYPYGQAKSAYFWPFVVAVLLFGVAGGFSLYEGWQKIVHPHPLADITLALAVLAVAFVIEAVVLVIAVREARKRARVAGIETVGHFLRDNRDATLLTIIVEDSLALIGLPIAAGSLLLARATGNPVWDGVGSMLIGVLLMGFALFLAYQVHALIIGRALAPSDEDRVRGILLADPHMESIVGLQSMHLGPDVVLLGADVELKDDLSTDEVEDALARMERRLLEEVRALKFVYLEPKEAPRKTRPASVPPRRGAHEKQG